MIKKGIALYSENKQETISYLEEVLTDLLKLRNKIHKINKDWYGIDRSSEMLIFRANKNLDPMQLFLEQVYFTLVKGNQDLKNNENAISNLNLNEYAIYRKAIEKWGKELQINQAFEKIETLILKLTRYIRGRLKPEDITQKIGGEIADVEIMLNQLKIIFDLEITCHNWKVIKLERIKEKLSEKK